MASDVAKIEGSTVENALEEESSPVSEADAIILK